MATTAQARFGVGSNPVNHVSTTVVDPAWGVPVEVTDPNGKITEAVYDGLGRLTGVWLPTPADASDGRLAWFDRHGVPELGG